MPCTTVILGRVRNERCWRLLPTDVQARRTMMGLALRLLMYVCSSAFAAFNWSTFTASTFTEVCLLVVAGRDPMQDAARDLVTVWCMMATRRAGAILLFTNTV